MAHSAQGRRLQQACWLSSAGCHLLQHAVQRPHHLPPVADGSGVCEEDEVKQQGVTFDHPPLGVLRPATGIFDMQGVDLLVLTELPGSNLVCRKQGSNAGKLLWQSNCRGASSGTSSTGGDGRSSSSKARGSTAS
jgi:hypothetical protein